VTGPQARTWLSTVLAGKIPAVGQARLAPMLSPSGRLLGDLSLFNWDDETWWITGSYYLRRWHLRWLRAQLPAEGVRIEDLSEAIGGFGIFGPKAREILARVTDSDVSNEAFPFMRCRVMDVGLLRARIGRLSITGELGYEISVPAAEHLTLYETLRDAGEDLGLTSVGYNAVLSLRLEKSFGIWNREFTWAYTPRMSGLSRFVDYDRVEFVGREAALADRDGKTQRSTLVTLEVDADNADASGFEPVWAGQRRVGFVTSGGYGHTVAKSLAMAYVDTEVSAAGTALEVHIVGDKRRCRVIAPSPFDPSGQRMRS
jgi:dimethylglycine dehydrogenase